MSLLDPIGEYVHNGHIVIYSEPTRNIEVTLEVQELAGPDNGLVLVKLKQVHSDPQKNFADLWNCSFSVAKSRLYYRRSETGSAY